MKILSQMNGLHLFQHLPFNLMWHLKTSSLPPAMCSQTRSLFLASGLVLLLEMFTSHATHNLWAGVMSVGLINYRINSIGLEKNNYGEGPLATK